MQEKILSNDGRIIFQFGDDLSVNSLLTAFLKAKFDGELNSDFLISGNDGVERKGVNKFIESILLHLKKDMPQVYGFDGVWEKDLSKSLNEKIRNFLLQNKKRIAWKTMSTQRKINFITEVYFPWKQSDEFIGDLLKELDKS